MKIFDSFKACYLIAIDPNSRCKSNGIPKVSQEAYNEITKVTGDPSYIACKDSFWNKVAISIGRSLCLKEVNQEKKKERFF